MPSKNDDRQGLVVDNFLAKRDDAGTQRTNMFCRYGSLYSYGTHFEMAKWSGVEYQRKELLLVNSSRYSVTTSKHQHILRRAIRSSLFINATATVVEHQNGNYFTPIHDKLLHSLYTLPNRLLKGTYCSETEIPSVIKALEETGESLKVLAALGRAPLFVGAPDENINSLTLDQLLDVYLRVGSVAQFDSQVCASTKMPVYLLYKVLGGKAVSKRKVKNPFYLYLSLKESMTPELALSYVSHENQYIARMAQDALGGN